MIINYCDEYFYSIVLPVNTSYICYFSKKEDSLDTLTDHSGGESLTVDDIGSMIESPNVKDIEEVTKSFQEKTVLCDKDTAAERNSDDGLGIISIDEKCVPVELLAKQSEAFVNKVIVDSVKYLQQEDLLCRKTVDDIDIKDEKGVSTLSDICGITAPALEYDKMAAAEIITEQLDVEDTADKELVQADTTHAGDHDDLDSCADGCLTLSGANKQAVSDVEEDTDLPTADAKKSSGLNLHLPRDKEQQEAFTDDSESNSQDDEDVREVYLIPAYDIGGTISETVQRNDPADCSDIVSDKENSHDQTVRSLDVVKPNDINNSKQEIDAKVSNEDSVTMADSSDGGKEHNPNEHHAASVLDKVVSDVVELVSEIPDNVDSTPDDSDHSESCDKLDDECAGDLNTNKDNGTSDGHYTGGNPDSHHEAYTSGYHNSGFSDKQTSIDNNNTLDEFPPSQHGFSYQKQDTSDMPRHGLTMQDSVIATQNKIAHYRQFLDKLAAKDYNDPYAQTGYGDGDGDSDGDDYSARPTEQYYRYM